MPFYLTSSSVHRENPDDRRKRIEESSLKKALNESLTSKSTYDAERCFSSLPELLTKAKFIDENIWLLKFISDAVCIMHIVIEQGPTVKCSLVINNNLEVCAFLQNEKLSKIGKHILPLKINNTDELSDILNSLYNLSNGKETFENLLESKFEALKNVLKSSSSDINENHLEFIEEQISFVTKKVNNFRYSNNTLIFSSLLFSLSPHAYIFARKSGNIILPHPSTIRSLCLKFNASPQIETIQCNFLGYIKQKFSHLESNDKIISLMLDEIHLKQYMDYKGGSIVGLATNSENMASSAHVFMISSLMSAYKDVVHILPVKTMTAEILFNVIKAVIVGLEKIGFLVICIVTDNNSINRKAVSYFHSSNDLKIVYPHPSDPTRPLFFLIDTVHLLKCIRNNWLNQKNPEKCFYFPPFGHQVTEIQKDFKTASFKTLGELHKIELNSIVKYCYNMSFKALNPSNIERQNVKLVLKIFNEFVCQGLLELGRKYELQHFQDTSDFIKIILNWWYIVNVKSPYKGIRLNNVYQSPLTNSENDEKIKFLNSFLDWLDTWEKMGCSTGSLSRETHSALKHSTYAILELADYCITELNFKYILPGKIQTDSLESRFGMYRQLAGSQYHISVRQLFESEKKLRIQSLLKLPTKSYGDIEISNFDMRDVLLNDDSTTDITIFDLTVTPGDIASCEEYFPVLTYLAGYCAFVVIKKLKCQSCKRLLTLDQKIELDSKYDFIEKLDRGKLQCPKDEIINIILHNYIVIKKLCCNFEKLFNQVHNQKNVVMKLTKKVLPEIFGDQEMCDEGHSIEKIVEMLISPCTNTFLNNYCKQKNDTLSFTCDLSKKRKIATLTS